MRLRNKFSPAERAVLKLSELTDFAWALNRAGFRAGLHRTHPAADWLAECGVELSEVWKNQASVFPKPGKKRRDGFQGLEKLTNKRKKP